MEEQNGNLRILIDKIAQEKGYDNASVDIKDISSGGANYTSTLYLATISASGKETLNLFAKVACMGDALRESNDMLNKGYETEKVFYTELAVAFKRLYDKHSVKLEDRLNMPKYYGHESTDKRETLVLENLITNGFECFDRFKTYDWEYASAAVSQLAKLHAIGIAAKEENFKELDSIRKIGLDGFAIDSVKEVFPKHALKIGKESVKEEYRPRLKKYLKEENILNDLAILWKTIDSGFLIHCDYRPSNLMHKKMNGKIEIVPLDYQTLHFGMLAADLMYFIWCGSDSKFRQKHYQQLLEHYYTELTMALRNLHIDINNVYPRKTYEQELETSKTLGLALGLTMMSILTVDPDNAPQLDSIESMAPNPNQLGLQKMNEIVEDYITWGII